MPALFLTDGAFALTALAIALGLLLPGRGPGRLAMGLCLAAALVALVMPVRSVVSFGVSLLAVALVYTLRPFGSAVPLLALPSLSPFARYLNAVVGFEWRLALSGAAGEAFVLMGREVSVRGTEIVLDGRAFGVDAACTGLHMALSAGGLALLLVAVVEWRAGRVLRVSALAAVLLATLALVLISNLARIIVLVERGWGPEHALHGATGLVAFFLYVSLPLLLGLPWLVRQDWAARAVRRDGFSRKRGSAQAKRPRWKLGGLALATLGFAFAKTRPPAPVATPGALAACHGQTPERRAHDVLAYRFSDALVYHKPIGAFYHAEHSPLICWRGSGYALGAVREAAAPDGEGRVYLATLERGGERLYTAWWMSNGERRTIRQATWRADMARGAAAYALVNVTAASPEALGCWVGELYGGG